MYVLKLSPFLLGELAWVVAAVGDTTSLLGDSSFSSSSDKEKSESSSTCTLTTRHHNV